MKRVGFQFKVRADMLDAYKKQHLNVWPDMLTALKETGWHNYTLFARGDGLIFGYFETDQGLPEALQKMAKKKINAKWQDLMTPFMDKAGRPDESFLELIEYFHLD